VPDGRLCPGVPCSGRSWIGNRGTGRGGIRVVRRDRWAGGSPPLCDRGYCVRAERACSAFVRVSATVINSPCTICLVGRFVVDCDRRGTAMHCPGGPGATQGVTVPPRSRVQRTPSSVRCAPASGCG